MPKKPTVKVKKVVDPVKELEKKVSELEEVLDVVLSFLNSQVEIRNMGGDIFTSKVGK